MYLSKLLGICEVINSNRQEHVEERVLLFVVSGKDQMIDKHRINIYNCSCSLNQWYILSQCRLIATKLNRFGSIQKDTVSKESEDDEINGGEHSPMNTPL